MALRRREESGAAAARWDDLPTDLMFDLTLCSSPGRTYRSWAAMLAIWEPVRAAALAEFAGRPEPWAERVRRYRERHGAAALALATSADIAADD